MGQRLSVDEIIKELRPKLSKVPGIQVYMQNPPAIQIGGRVSKSLYQFAMQSSDIATLYPAANQLVDEVRKSDLMQDVTSDLQLGNPQASVEIDRDRAASLGVSAKHIETALYNAYGSGQVSTIYTPNNQYWVVMELLPQYQQDLSAMSLLYVRSNSGTLVPLSAVATITQSAGALSVNHSGQLPSVTLSFNLRPGVALGQATAEVQTHRESGSSGNDHDRLLRHCAGVPGRRRPACSRCSASRSSSSTSCSESSTRASSIRSRFSPAFRSPRSARCSRC